MELIRFSDKLAGKDPTAAPYRIPARDLDSNFAKLKPLKTDGNKRQYAINETPEGWFLTLFPDLEAFNELQIVEVERCDGKRMKVLGTGWYDP